METKNSLLTFFDWYQSENIQNLYGCRINIVTMNESTELINIVCPYSEMKHFENLIEKYQKYLQSNCKTLTDLHKVENFRDLLFFKFVYLFAQNDIEKLKVNAQHLPNNQIPYLYLSLLNHDFTFQWSIQVLYNDNLCKSEFTPFGDMYEKFKNDLYEIIENKLKEYRNECLQHLLNEEELKENLPCLSMDLDTYEDYDNEFCKGYIICKRVSADNLEGYFFQITDC